MGLHSDWNIFDPEAPPRQKRPLQVDPPDAFHFLAGDGTPLRLTRYQGGSKGPVILSHCIGVSSLMYATDTIETNLLEYLYAREFDVWLLDFRFSIELPASRNQATMDDVATQDYPAAVSKVRELAGADSVQVVAHGVGSSTFPWHCWQDCRGCAPLYVLRCPRISSCRPSTELRPGYACRRLSPPWASNT